MHPAGNISDGDHVYPGQVGAEEELADSLMLGGIGVGSGHQVDPVHVATAAGPGLLPVNNIRVAVLGGFGLE
ncbi:hypothetical protein ES703_117270 [subsurface metagenome]